MQLALLKHPYYVERSDFKGFDFAKKNSFLPGTAVMVMRMLK